MNRHLLAKTYFTPYQNGLYIRKWDSDVVIKRLPANVIPQGRFLSTNSLDTRTVLALTHHVQGHCMDVAAAAVALYRLHVSRSVKRLFHQAGLDDHQAEKIVCLAGLIHDIGKASWAFQNKILHGLPRLPELLPENPFDRTADPDSVKELMHATASLIMYKQFTGVPDLGPVGDYLLKAIAAHHGWQPRFPKSCDGGFTEDFVYGLDGLSPDISCFLGRPPKETQAELSRIANEMIVESIGVACHDVRVPEDCPDGMVNVVAGILMLADWVGSDSSVIPHWSVDQADEYWHHAVPAAEERVRLLGLADGTNMTAPRGQFSWSSLGGEGFEPSPLQERVLMSAARREEAVLVCGNTGDGKTIAGLAYGLLNESDGMLFCLPTRATSNAIAKSMEKFAAQFGLKPMIAHSSTVKPEELEALWLEDIGEEEPVNEPMNFASNGRKGMQHKVVACTADQIIAAAMTSRYYQIRHLAIRGRTVVIDEPHSYGTGYTFDLLLHAVRAVRSMGCRVIVMTATLSDQQRSSLLVAMGLPVPQERYYPEVVDSKGATPVKSRRKPRRVSMTLFRGEWDRQKQAYEMEDMMAKSAAVHASRGANVGVVMNSVAVAQRVHASLLARGVDCELMHSRFCLGHRMDREGRLLTALGPDPSTRPRGKIVVATQVIEQSVDMCFDVMLTELCPGEFIMQRIGRLHRHPHGRPRGYARPAVEVYVPTRDGAFNNCSYIYPRHDMLATLIALDGREVISEPRDFRLLVEESCDPDTSGWPDDLQMEYLELRQDEEKYISEELEKAMMPKLKDDQLHRDHRRVMAAYQCSNGKDALFPTRLSTIFSFDAVLVDKDGRLIIGGKELHDASRREVALSSLPVSGWQWQEIYVKLEEAFKGLKKMIVGRDCDYDVDNGLSFRAQR